MSFVLAYHRLFSIAVQEQGSNTTLPGFSFTPTAATRRKLADHQLLFRSRESFCAVYYTTNPLAAVPLMGSIRTRVRFVFGLRLAQIDFFKRYKPDLTGASPQLYLDNLTPSGAIQSKVTLSEGVFVQTNDTARLYPHVFTLVQESGAQAAQNYTVKEKFGTGDVVLQAAAATLTPINLSRRPGGAYSLESDAPNATPTTLFLDDDLAGAGALAAVQIDWESLQSQAPAGGVNYLIQFQKR